MIISRYDCWKRKGLSRRHTGWATYLFLNLWNIITAWSWSLNPNIWYFIRSKKVVLIYHSYIFFAQVQWNDTVLKITIHHSSFTCFPAYRVVEAKKHATSVWLISYSGALCNKSCIIKRSEKLISWSAFCYTAEYDEAGDRKEC